MTTKTRVFASAAMAALGSAAVMVATPAAADALASPSMTPPLAANDKPTTFDGGPLGKIYVTGAVSGLAFGQSNHSPFDRDYTLDLSNGQVVVQTTTGPVQFYVQAGSYSFPSLGTPYTKASPTTNATFGNVPVAYVKLQPTAEVSLQVGKLPTLIGAEYAFTFQNMNIERGLLWNQEPVTSDGVQFNYTKGAVTASVSLNDGFYSNKYNWVSGLFTYTFNPVDSFTIDGGFSLSDTKKATTATPLLQNNGGILNLSWTHTQGPWVINPYFQYTKASSIKAFGSSFAGADSYSGAVLAKYSFNPELSVAGRLEYIKTSSTSCPKVPGACVQSNILYGPDSSAFSATITPTYQKGVFFIRGEASVVGISKVASGSGFGTQGKDKSQFRALLETGVLF